jgi:hypothetical protein
MGWVLFIAGRALNAWNRVSRNQKSIGEELKDYRERLTQREIELETRVPGEIKRLKSKGKDIDGKRELVRNRFKKYIRLGSKLELQIIKELQQKTVAGEEVSYKKIEREVLDAAPKNSIDELKENKFSKALFVNEKIYATNNTVQLQAEEF